MAEILLSLQRLHEGQQRIRDCKHRFRCAAIGRRWGKTHFGVDEAVEAGLDGKAIGWFAPTYKLLAGEGGVWPYALRLLQPIVARVSVQEHTLRLLTGGTLEFWSLENGGADKARGREYDLVVIDEAAMVPDLMPQWDNAIRAMLATRQGRALFLSTPRGFNDFYALYLRGGDPEYSEDWASFHEPSSASPFFPPEEWAALLRAVERGELSAATFAQEYEAVFTAPEGLVYGLDRDGVAFYEPSRTIRPAPARWEDCKWRIAGIDPGGGSDPTGLVAEGITEDDRHHVYFAERRHGKVSVFDLHDWLSDLHAIAPLDAVMVGETGGEGQTETLRRMGWRAFRAALSPGDKGRGIQHVREMFKSGRLTIGPAFRTAFDEEVYVYRFRPREVGSVADQQWATLVESPEHHAELLDTVRYIEMGALDGYPGAVQAAGIVRAGQGRSAVRRVSR